MYAVRKAIEGRNLPPNNNEWQKPTRKHTIHSKQQSTTPKIPSTPTENKYEALSLITLSLITPENIKKTIEGLHAATDKRPTKEHNNITSQLSYYEDINTNNTPKSQVKQPHTYTTTEPRNRTDTNKTSPTQHIHKTLDKTPHTSNPQKPTQTHTTNRTIQNTKRKVGESLRS